MTDTLRAASTGLKVLLIGPDTPAQQRRVWWLLAAAAALYLFHGGTTYLELKSGLPLALCATGGLALAAPMLLLVTRPLLAWRVAWLAAAVTGVAVQAHGRTPFSWHPAVLAAQLVILFVLALRLPYAVSAWAWTTMVALIALSFFPADRVGIAVIAAVVMATAALIRAARRHRSTRRSAGRPGAPMAAVPSPPPVRSPV